MADFHHAALIIFFTEFMKTGPVYIREWVGRAQSRVGGGKSLNKEARRHK